MRCSGCGKDIPFHGEVCPYCQRDKSDDQKGLAGGILLGLILGVVGYFLFDWLAALGGFLLGCLVGGLAIGAKKTAPPKVQVVPGNVERTPAVSGLDLESRLTQLKAALDSGLISQAEYEEKKRDVLARF